MVIAATPPQGKRLGFMLAIEGGCWMVTLGGLLGERVPTDSEGYLSLPARFRGQTSTTSSGAPRRSVTWRVSHSATAAACTTRGCSDFPARTWCWATRYAVSIRSMARA